MPEANRPASEWLNEVATRMQAEREAGAAVAAERLTVRELLAIFGYARRGQLVVREIRHTLETFNLRTSPDFEYVYIDNSISIELDDDGDDGAAGDGQEPTSPTVRVDSLTAAHNTPVSVTPDDTVVLAITRMTMNGFSQLPVMTSEREVRGVISWHSIGRAYANGRNPQRVRECMEKAHEISIETTFAEATHTIWKYDYVLVRGVDRRITGILTAADLALQFEELAHPFLLIGEIEHHLRHLVRNQFTVEELTEAAMGQEGVRGPDDLTFGGYCQLLGREEWWERLHLMVDRREFVRRLERVRIIRNDVMHFSPDGIVPEDVEQLDQLVRFLRELRQR